MEKINLRSIIIQKYINLTNFGLITVISITLALKFRLIFLIEANWDEFKYLSQVHSFLRGELSNLLQTVHVHFFTWVTKVSNNEVLQIIAARSVLYLLFLGTCYYIYLIGRQVLNRSGSLFGVLCYISFSNIVDHGVSFRADSTCSFLFLFSVYQIVVKYRSKFSIILSGFAMGLSLMVSIKVFFHLATIGLIFLSLFVLEKEKKNMLKPIVFFTLCFIGSYWMLYLFHTSMLPIAPSQESLEFAGRAYEKVILLNYFFPRFSYFAFSLYENPIIWSLLFIGILFIIFKSVRLKTASIHKLTLFVFLMPLFTLLFYRNAFPYYYVFIIAPGIIFCGVVVHEIIEDYKKKGSIIFLIFAGIFSISVFISFMIHYNTISSDQIAAQKDTIKNIHKIFPDPVPYIDRCASISSFKKFGFFMSTWGIDDYRKAGKLIIYDILTQHHPLFVLVNIPSLDLSLPRNNEFVKKGYTLFKEDWDLLQANYIHHWGLIYVAGKKFRFDSKNNYQNFEILIPGIYTLEANCEILINNKPHQDGSQIQLKRGIHTINSTITNTVIRLRWGENIYKPSTEPLSDYFFKGF